MGIVRFAHNLLPLRAEIPDASASSATVESGMTGKSVRWCYTGDYNEDLSPYIGRTKYADEIFFPKILASNDIVVYLCRGFSVRLDCMQNE
jgi:hypothetical protein